MIGIDTNVLVRLHVEDDAEQYQKAKDLIEKCTIRNPLFISHIVLIEFCWVLRSSYKVPKEKVIEEIEYYINAGDVFLENQELCRDALSHYKQSSVDFSDCLIGTLAEKNNCQTTYTFDQKASNLSTFTLLE
ncbi:MAG TPA: type II toxin-antitoxin system VapC family toxin [Balneolaceae bacterium]|nr:type II toxin-antitoxin system VapC family toxin [Balneolaceae bacterium]